MTVRFPCFTWNAKIAYLSRDRKVQYVYWNLWSDTRKQRDTAINTTAKLKSNTEKKKKVNSSRESRKGEREEQTGKKPKMAVQNSNISVSILNDNSLNTIKWQNAIYNIIQQ